MNRSNIGFLIGGLLIASLAVGLVIQHKQNAELIRKLTKSQTEDHVHQSGELSKASTPSNVAVTTVANLPQAVSEGEATSSAESDRLKAVQQGAEQGDPEAQFTLAVFYERGLGVRQSYVESGKLLRKAAEAGFAEAQYFLADRYAKFGASGRYAEYRFQADGSLTKSGGIDPRNDFEAARWCRKAADQGLPAAQLQLGLMYLNGQGIPKDFVEALKWATLAAASQNKLYGVASEAAQNKLSGAASEIRDKLAGLMNIQATTEAQRRAAAFVARPQFDYTTNRFGIAVPKGSGTGFFITEDGYLLTNFHVIDGAKRIVVSFGKRNLPGRVLKTDKNHDVALLKVDGVFHPLSVADSREIELGASVFTLGFPDPEVQGYEPKLTTGTVNSLSGIRDDRRYFQISVPVQPGNSGGPLLDQSGAVVGMVSLMRAPKFRRVRMSVEATSSSIIRCSAPNSSPLNSVLSRMYRYGLDARPP
jgi:hypothetical protein